MKRLFALLVLPLALTLGCAGGLSNVAPTIDDIAQKALADVEQAEIWVSLISDAAHLIFGATAMPDVQAKFDGYVRDAKIALSVIADSAHGAQAVTQVQLDAAYVNLRAAWEGIQQIGKDLGIVSADGKTAVAKNGRVLLNPPRLKILDHKG